MSIRARGGKRYSPRLLRAAALGVILETSSLSEAGVPRFTKQKNFKTNQYEAKLEFIKGRCVCGGGIGMCGGWWRLEVNLMCYFSK